MKTDARKMMKVIGGDHDGATVEVEDYTFAVRLPILPLVDGNQHYALYYRASIKLQDDDGTIVDVEFLRTGKLSVRKAIESVLLPAEPSLPGATKQ